MESDDTLGTVCSLSDVKVHGLTVTALLVMHDLWMSVTIKCRNRLSVLRLETDKRYNRDEPTCTHCGLSLSVPSSSLLQAAARYDC